MGFQYKPKLQDYTPATLATTATKDRVVTPLSKPELDEIVRWLDYIEEHDTETRLDVIDQCKSNMEVRKRFLKRASNVTTHTNVIPIRPEIGLPDCPTCRHQQ